MFINSNHDLLLLKIKSQKGGGRAFWSPILNRIEHLPKAGAKIFSSKIVVPKFSIPKKLESGP